MILDDLFTQAATDYAKYPDITTSVAIATNESQGFRGPSNSTYETSGTLRYTPAETVKSPIGEPHTTAAFFSGTAGEFSLTITAPQPDKVLGSPDPYQVDISVTKAPTGWAPFAAQVDPSSNVVYGSPGPRFVTLSLCSYQRSNPGPPPR
jgi:hypothetical protein